MRFNRQEGLITLHATICGPLGESSVKLAIDTGASVTVISEEALRLIGYETEAMPRTVRFTTGSQVETAARISLLKITALEQDRDNFSVIAHTLPPSASMDGVLGLDFFRGRVLTLDFQQGEIRLN